MREDYWLRWWELERRRRIVDAWFFSNQREIMGIRVTDDFPLRLRALAISILVTTHTPALDWTARTPFLIAHGWVSEYVAVVPGVAGRNFARTNCEPRGTIFFVPVMVLFLPTTSERFAHGFPRTTIQIDFPATAPLARISAFYWLAWSYYSWNSQGSKLSICRL